MRRESVPKDLVYTTPPDTTQNTVYIRKNKDSEVFYLLNKKTGEMVFIDDDTKWERSKREDQFYLKPLIEMPSNRGRYFYCKNPNLIKPIKMEFKEQIQGKEFYKLIEQGITEYQITADKIKIKEINDKYDKLINDLKK